MLHKFTDCCFIAGSSIHFPWVAGFIKRPWVPSISRPLCSYGCFYLNSCDLPRKLFAHILIKISLSGFHSQQKRPYNSWLSPGGTARFWIAFCTIFMAASLLCCNASQGILKGHGLAPMGCNTTTNNLTNAGVRLFSKNKEDPFLRKASHSGKCLIDSSMFVKNIVSYCW